MKLLNILKPKKPINCQAYFNLFEKLFFLDPLIYYWIKPFPEKKGRYILTHFKHHDFIKYNGLELVIIDKNLMTYHRLPGAKPNGHGHVNIGPHYISLNSMNEKEQHWLQVNKINSLDLSIKSISNTPAGGINYQHLPCRTLAYERFIPELIEIILSGLDWHYRNLLMGNKEFYQQNSQWIQTVEAMKNPELDFRIGMLRERISKQ